MPRRVAQFLLVPVLLPACSSGQVAAGQLSSPDAESGDHVTVRVPMNGSFRRLVSVNLGTLCVSGQKPISIATVQGLSASDEIVIDFGHFSVHRRPPAASSVEGVAYSGIEEAAPGVGGSEVTRRCGQEDPELLYVEITAPTERLQFDHVRVTSTVGNVELPFGMVICNTDRQEGSRC